MSNKRLQTRIVNKHDIEANWDQAVNFIPLKGEIIIYDAEQAGDKLPDGRTELITKPRFKVGDGVNFVVDLPFSDADVDTVKSVLEYGDPEIGNDYKCEASVKTFITDDGSANIRLEAIPNTGISSFIDIQNHGVDIGKITLSAPGPVIDIAYPELVVGEEGVTVKGDKFTFNGAKVATIDDITGTIGKPGTATGAEIFNDYRDLNNGEGNEASGDYSHAEGCHTIAGGDYGAHAEGKDTHAFGSTSHAEGYRTNAMGNNSHTEGIETTTSATANGAHAEGGATHATNEFAHAEGYDTYASGYVSHAEGISSTASGEASHAEGHVTTASGIHAHAEGSTTIASGESSHAEGNITYAGGDYGSHAEGNQAQAIGTSSHAEGAHCEAHGENSHAEGAHSITYDNSSHAEGWYTTAHGRGSHSEGYRTTSISSESGHIEGHSTNSGSDFNAWQQAVLGQKYENAFSCVAGDGAHVEGADNYGLGHFSHTEGKLNVAYSPQSHAEGLLTQALGDESHTEGFATIAYSGQAHAGGNNTVVGRLFTNSSGIDSERTGQYARAAFAHGLGLQASAPAQAVFGKYNVESEDAIFIVGNGEDEYTRSNAFEVISTTSGAAIKVGETILTESDINKILNFINAWEVTES